MTRSEGDLPGETVIGRVALRVNDLDRMVDFYEAVVGLERRSTRDGRVELGVDDATLLVLIGDPGAPERGPDETGLFHAAFHVPSRAALGDALERIEGQWRLDGASDHLVSEAIYLSDPEDNGIEVYHDRPRGEWPRDADGGIAIDTLPLALDEIREAGGGASDAPPGTTVGHVHLEVSSIPATRAFYGDALGMRVRQTYGNSAVFLAAGDYHHHVGVNVWNGRSRPASGRGLEWFELVVPDRTALEGVRERCALRDVSVTDLDAGFEARDPDRIALRVRAPA